MLLSIIYANNLSSTTISDGDFTCTQYITQMAGSSWMYIKNTFDNNQFIKDFKESAHNCNQEVGRYCCGRENIKEEATSTAPPRMNQNSEEPQREHLKNMENIFKPMVGQSSMK